MTGLNRFNKERLYHSLGSRDSLPILQVHVQPFSTDQSVFFYISPNYKKHQTNQRPGEGVLFTMSKSSAVYYIIPDPPQVTQKLVSAHVPTHTYTARTLAHTHIHIAYTHTQTQKHTQTRTNTRAVTQTFQDKGRAGHRIHTHTVHTCTQACTHTCMPRNTAAHTRVRTQTLKDNGKIDPASRNVLRY